MSKLIFKRFTRDHYKAYNSWFENERIKKALFDIEGNWLDYILNDKTGIEYVVYDEDELVAVVGIILPTDQHPTYGIKNIAVNPSIFRRGIGSKVLSQLVKMHKLESGQYWIAFVDFENLSAQSFFKKNGWLKNENGEAGDDMYRYEKK